MGRLPAALEGRYALRHPLCDGAFGTVYEAFDIVERRPVAVKLIEPDLRGEEISADQAEREHALMSMVSHRAVAESYAAGRYGEMGFVVMQLVQGEDLCHYINRHVADGINPGPAELLPIVQQLCEGLQAVHDAGLVHRDVKPANVMVTPSGEVRLVDFGAAQTIAEPTALWGTPLYIAPEITLGRQLPPRRRTLSDIYSLGVTVFELLSGEEPFELDSRLEIAEQLLRQLHQRPRWLGLLRPDLPAAVSQLLHQAMSPEPYERPASPMAFYQALASAMPPARRKQRRLVIDTLPMRRALPYLPTVPSIAA
ncbi:MAG: serine/threonine protein kinase [Myxococcales bacterium]|nr:serine/threonine protein kinase [Myxococcales bacterium]